MEKQTEYLFYVGIKTKDDNEKTASVDGTKVVLPFYGGKLVVYSIFLPGVWVMPIKKGFRWQRRHREKKRAERLHGIIGKAVHKVRQELEGERITYCQASHEIAKYLPPELAFWQESDGDALADRLYEVYLYRQRQANKAPVFSISLPEECGELMVMRLLTVMKPYLSRINEVLFVGTEDAGAQMLEDYLYDEYGIVMGYGRYPLKNAIWINFEQKQKQKLYKYAKENEICHINGAEVLKFLDTAAKNGYNTKVN